MMAPADLNVWEQVAPDVRDLMNVVNSACDHLTAIFPATLPPQSSEVDVDSAFDLMARQDRGQDMDRVVDGFEGESEATLGQSIATLIGMLRETLGTFSHQIRSPKVVSDRWFLLGELHDFKSNATQCLEAVIVTILNSFSPRSARVRVAPIHHGRRTCAPASSGRRRSEPRRHSLQ